MDEAMEVFYSFDIRGNEIVLPPEESFHCVKVLRHCRGEQINVIDGAGNMYVCSIVTADPRSVVASVRQMFKGWNGHDYNLTMAVCPTKNADRFEWFVEKATEIGVDTIVPLIGEHSERKACKLDRIRKLVLAAAKQSLKAQLPHIADPLSVKEFVATPGEGAKFIACCFDSPEHPRLNLMEVLKKCSDNRITVLIGPEGDFSANELNCALTGGFIPVHLGSSRLRTETAAVVATTMVYSAFNYEDRNHF